MEEPSNQIPSVSFLYLLNRYCGILWLPLHIGKLEAYKLYKVCIDTLEHLVNIFLACHYE